MTTVVTKEWIDEVLEEHKRLRVMVAELRQTLCQPRPEAGQPGSHSWASDLSVRLDPEDLREVVPSDKLFILSIANL